MVHTLSQSAVFGGCWDRTKTLMELLKDDQVIASTAQIISTTNNTHLRYRPQLAFTLLVRSDGNVKTESSPESNRSGTGFSSGDGIIHLCPGYSSGSQVSWGWCQLRLVSAHACPGWVPGWLALEQRILSNLLVWFGAAFLLNPLFETSVSA